jgi:probable rRNA maturation factor
LEVLVVNRQRSHRVCRDDLAEFLNRIVDALPTPVADSVAVALVSDRRIREFNRRFRGKDRPTDVLSFPVGDDDAPSGERHLGDIVISVSTAAEHAKRSHRSLDRELKVLLVHGYLHLLGHDHETDDGTMIRLQRSLLRRLLPPLPGESR